MIERERQGSGVRVQGKYKSVGRAGARVWGPGPRDQGLGSGA